MKLTPRLLEAINIATIAHDGQFRKGTNVPYISHPYLVAIIISNYTDDEDMIIAGLFHDILEDVSPDIYSENQMRKDFGSRITDLVKSTSEDKRPDQPEKPWKMRKTNYLDHLQTASVDALLVSAADKISNLQSILLEYSHSGNSIWKKFNAPYNNQLWYYLQFSKIVSDRLSSPISDDLRILVKQLANLR